MLCSQCHVEGHNRRTCPLNNEQQIFVITYALVARNFPLPGGGQIQVQMPNLFHHGIVVHGMEYGYGRHGITVIRPGTFYNHRNRPGYWRIHAYTPLPAQFQIGITRRQMANIVNQLANDGFVVGQYCCFHRNCVTFCQHVIRQIFRRHRRVAPPLVQWPQEVQQYPFDAINPILNAINFFAPHNGPHQCVFLS